MTAAWDPARARQLIAEARDGGGLVRVTVESGPEHVDAGRALADHLEAATTEVAHLAQEREDAWAAHETIMVWWTDASDRAARQCRELESLRAQNARLVAEMERLGQELTDARADAERMQPVADAAGRWAPSARVVAMHARMPKIELDLYHAAVAYRASKAGT